MGVGGRRGCSEGEVIRHAGGIQDIVPDGRVEACQVKAGRVHKSAPACTCLRPLKELTLAHMSANSGDQSQPSQACTFRKVIVAAAVLTCRVSGDWCREQSRGSLTRTDRAGDAGNVGFALHAEAQRLAAAEAVLQSVHSALRLRRLAPSICSADGLD